jgi:methylmalonyl-CoA carboxyltransferase large subunit
MAQNMEINDILAILEETRAQIATLNERVARLEAVSKIQTTDMADGKTVSKPVAPATPAEQAITEEEIVAISAALGAYLGVRVHIRQVRLLSSSTWAQQGRVAVRARTLSIY